MACNHERQQCAEGASRVRRADVARLAALWGPLGRPETVPDPPPAREGPVTHIPFRTEHGFWIFTIGSLRKGVIIKPVKAGVFEATYELVSGVGSDADAAAVKAAPDGKFVKKPIPLPDLRRLFLTMLARVHWDDCKVRRCLGISDLPDVSSELELAALAYKAAGGDWEELT